MKFVYVTPFLRVPPDFGIAIRNYHILKHLTTRNAVTVVTYGVDDTGETDAWLRGRGANVVRLEYAFPWSVARGRMMTLKNLLAYPPASFQRYAPRALQRTLDAMAGRTEIDVLVLDTALTGQAALAGRLPGRPVLVLPDIYQLLLRREMETIGRRPFQLAAFGNWVKTRRYEDRILKKYTTLIAVSEADRAYLQAHYPLANTVLASNGTDTNYYTPAARAEQTNSVLFVGGFEYAPNEDAFFYFCREILPLIHLQEPEMRFVAVGRSPTEAMRAYVRTDERVELTGRVEDVRPFYHAARAVVVPLRTGGGVKLKTLEAFAMGVPVVSTGVGAEGIAVRDGEELLTADSPREFADRVVELARHPERGDELARRARALVEREYDWQVICARFEEFLSQESKKGARNHQQKDLP